MRYVPQEQKKEQSTESKLLDASKTFSNFLASAGMMLSKGLEMLGGYLSKKIDPSESVRLSPTTKILIEKSVGASKKLLEYSTEKFAGVFRVATKQAVSLQSTITKTDAGKKLQENGTIDSANNFLRIGFEAITNIYDGFAKGYDEASNGLSKGAREVINAKYGPEAGDAALKLAEGYRNVNKLPKVANDALKMVLLETAKNAVVPKK